MLAHALDAAPTEDRSRFWKLTVGAVGVVYGDIGTSPIYAFREALHSVASPGTADVLGILSLIIWALMLIVTVKYVALLLRVDNEGEGGTLALMSLVRSASQGHALMFLLMGIFGAALFYGDAIITPALSVLSAVEGMEEISPNFTAYVLPITSAIILALFLFQSRGTQKVSALFGPVIAVWFLVLAGTGVQHILQEPGVLQALNPYYALSFVAAHGSLAFVTLGAVFLAVTGAEALYADLGHFGKSPIRAAWLWFVLPALALNYLGQGALVLHTPEAAENPFFRMVPESLTPALIVLTTLATIIASQAVITGAYSMTQQAIALGLLPRMQIRQTSHDQQGQIYMPRINYLMMLGVLFLIIVFRSSSNLAAAYGISVTGTMVITAILLYFVARNIWKKSPVFSVLLVAPFLLIDCLFLGSNALKIFEGGWVALAVAGAMAMMMLTWVRGSALLASRERKRQPQLLPFIERLAQDYPEAATTPGAAFFFAADPDYVPHALLINLRHNKTLHEDNIVLSVHIENTPTVPAARRMRQEKLAARFYRLHLTYGFMEIPDVQKALLELHRDPQAVIRFEWSQTSLFLSHKTLRADPRYGLPLWQDMIYMWMNGSATEATDFYRLPTGRVIELGRHVVI